MIHGERWSVHDDAALRRISDAAFHLLCNVGAQVRHEGVLRKLEALGCRVDMDKLHCHFTEKVLRQVLEHFRGDSPATVEIPRGWSPAQRTGTSGSYPHLLDWPACRRRLATVQDVVDNAKMAHVLDEFASVGKTMTCFEIDQRIEPIWSIVNIMGLTDKPVAGGEVMYAEHVKHLVRLGEICSGSAGDVRFVAACDFNVSPLVYGRRMLECRVEKAKFKVPHVPGTMAVSGLSGPVTLAGTVALCVAELIGGWVIGYALDPELPVGGITASGSLDMRTTRANFGSPEAVLQDLSVCQICEKLHGIRIHAAYGYVDCKRPGIGAVYEKMFPLVVFPMTGRAECGGGGLLSAGQDYSPVQHLLELDIAGSVGRFLGSYEVNDETLALDVIDEVGVATGRTFLDTAHTAEHYKAEQWYPRWLDRRIWQGDEIERDAERHMLERIDAYWRDAVARYQQPAIDQPKLAAARDVLAAAEREMEQLNPKA